jgi:hypothetical protein
MQVVETSGFYVFARHNQQGLSVWQLPSDPEDETSDLAPVCYESWEVAALDTGSNVAGSVHGIIEIHTSLEPSKQTLVARCRYSEDGPVWEAGPLGTLTDGVVFPAESA